MGVTVQDASARDTTTLVDTLVTAAEQVEAVGAPGIAEIVADKGYHSNETIVGFAALGVRSYVSEQDRGQRHWKGQAAARDAMYANRRRIRGARGKRLLRQRDELLERPNAHLYETGGMHRVQLRGHPNAHALLRDLDIEAPRETTRILGHLRPWGPAPGADPGTGTPQESRPAGSRRSKPSGTTRSKSHSNRHIPRNSKSLGVGPETGLKYPERPRSGS